MENLSPNVKKLQSSPLKYPSSIGNASLPREPSNSTLQSSVYSVPSQRAQRHDIDLPRTQIDPTATKTLIWATSVDPNESIAMFRDFLENFTMSHRLQYELQEEFDPSALRSEDRMPYYPRILRQRAQDGVHILNLECTNMKAYSPAKTLYDQLTRYPQEIVLHVLDYVCSTMFCEMFDRDPAVVAFRCRPYGLLESTNLRDLNPEDIDKLVSIKGFVIRTSNPIPELKEGAFQCSDCGSIMFAAVENGRVTEPSKCSQEDCNCKDIQIVHARSTFYDKQVIRIQETPDSVPDGQTPHTVSLVVYDELVDICKPGDRIEVTGIYKAMGVRLNPRQRISQSLFKTFVDALHIKSSEKRRIGETQGDLKGDAERIEQNHESQQHDPRVMEKIVELSQLSDLYERLSSSLAPSIYSREDAKKAVLLQLFNGTSKSTQENQKYRGNIHVLLCGDPATSKSQILQYVHRLAPRGIYTSGKGSSAVGLTAYVTRDPDTRQLVLESGALVLSDGGICCIDEFDKMSDSTRSVLHEAMEQQTVSVAKAGIITTLNARTSILAAANPIYSRWHQKLSVAQNLNLPPTLLSRFDIIYLMLDRPDEQEDTLLARHITNLYLSDDDRVVRKDLVDMNLFASYVGYAHENIFPRMEDDCIDLIAEAYCDFRQLGTMSATTRQLEAIIRLSEAHAKMRLSQIVEQRDVLEAVRLIKASMQTAATDPITGVLDLDMVTLGKSTRERQEKQGAKRVMEEILVKLSRSRVTSILKTDLIKQVADKCSITGDFDKLLAEVIDDHSEMLLKGALVVFEKL